MAQVVVVKFFHKARVLPATIVRRDLIKFKVSDFVQQVGAYS